MPRKTKADTTTTTIRLDTRLRELLEVIAAREERSLTQQMTLFLRTAAQAYADEHRLLYYDDIGTWGTPGDYYGYLQTKDAPDAADSEKPE